MTVHEIGLLVLVLGAWLGVAVVAWRVSRLERWRAAQEERERGPVVKINSDLSGLDTKALARDIARMAERPPRVLYTTCPSCLGSLREGELHSCPGTRCEECGAQITPETRYSFRYPEYTSLCGRCYEKVVSRAG